MWYDGVISLVLYSTSQQIYKAYGTCLIYFYMARTRTTYIRIFLRKRENVMRIALI